MHPKDFSVMVLKIEKFYGVDYNSFNVNHTATPLFSGMVNVPYMSPLTYLLKEISKV